MEEMLETPFYHQDDILTSSIPPSVLYDKNSLELNLQTCPDLSSQSIPSEHGEKPTSDVQQNSIDSPSLDFLKLGSPDLERMFMNFQGNVSASPCDDQSAAFTFSGEITGEADSSFTEALQQLHDQQENISGNRELKSTKINQICANSHVISESAKEAGSNVRGKKRNPARNKRQHHEEETFAGNQVQNNRTSNNNSIGCLNNNHVQRRHDEQCLTATSCSQPQAPVRPHMSLNLPTSATSQGLVNINGHMIPQEQFILNNMAVIGNANHHMMPPQMQQEIAFLNHAMGYMPERDGIPQALMEHVTMADPTLQLRHLQNRFQEGSFIEAGYPERAQMPMAGIENIHLMSQMDEQAKKFLENNPHYQPIDLELQELVKRERKKLRNRVASSKCRKRKLEREARLEMRVKDLKEKNIELGAVANALKQQVCDLKQRVMDHVNEGCQIVLAS